MITSLLHNTPLPPSNTPSTPFKRLPFQQRYPPPSHLLPPHRTHPDYSSPLLASIPPPPTHPPCKSTPLSLPPSLRFLTHLPHKNLPSSLLLLLLHLCHIHSEEKPRRHQNPSPTIFHDPSIREMKRTNKCMISQYTAERKR